MANFKLSATSLESYNRYLSLLANNPAYIPPLVSDLVLLETQVLSSNSSSVTFSGLSSYASTYRHLQIRSLSRCTNSSSLAALNIRFNGDSGANYSNHALENINDIMYSGNGVSHTQISHYIPGNVSNAGSFSPLILDILEAFSTNKNKVTRALSGFTYPGSWQILQMTSGGWYNTSAITSITITPNQNQLLAGSRYSIYGVK